MSTVSIRRFRGIYSQALRTTYDLTAHITRFCRLLRAAGLLVGPREAGEAVRALGLVDVLDRGQVYWALRTVLVSRREDIAAFDEMFERLWSFEPLARPRPTRPGMSRAGGDEGAQAQAPGARPTVGPLLG